MRAVLRRGPQGEDKKRTRASKAYWTALKRQRETESTPIRVHRDHAIIETLRGARQTYRRGPVEVGRVVLAWQPKNS